MRLLESTKAIPWEADAESWLFTYVGPQAVDLFGYPVEKWHEKNFWADCIHPEDRKIALDTCLDFSRRLKDYEFEYRMLASNGGVVWVRDIVNVEYAGGRPRTLRGFFIDITDLKQTEQALFIEKQRAQQFLDVAGVMIVVIDRHQNTLLINKEGCEVLGANESEIVGRNWFDHFLPEGERERVKGAFSDLIASRIDPVEYYENRVLTKSGKEKIIAWHNTLLRNESGEIFATLSSGEDITERKASEEALHRNQEELRSLAGRLLSAQEEERRRLARELHDDLTQRLAVIGIELGKLKQETLAVGSPFYDKIRGIKDLIVKLSEDVHGISRRLHPSIIDDLGLIEAIRSECSNYSRLNKTPVRFAPSDVPGNLSNAVSLCLYRIVQEGLRNISKHARAKDVEITLGRENDTLRLLVRDSGKGFEPDRIPKGGLGLASMKERVRFINGTLSVRSAPGSGTDIEVRVPLDGAEA